MHMSALRRHWYRYHYLPAHWLSSSRLFWLDITLQHVSVRDIVEAAARNLPCGLAESNAPAKQPISLDRNRSTCPPRSRRERASHEQHSSNERGQTKQRGRHLRPTSLPNANTKRPRVYNMRTCRQETSVRQQIPLGSRVSMRNPAASQGRWQADLNQRKASEESTN